MTHESSKIIVLCISCQIFKKSLSAKEIRSYATWQLQHGTHDPHSMTNCPFPPNVCPSSGRISSHSVVHSFDPSDQGPSHPASPQGSRRTTKRFPRISTALTTEWDRLPTSPSTAAFFTPLRKLSRVLNQQPKRRSWLALTSSSCQNLSRSRMSYRCIR